MKVIFVYKKNGKLYGFNACQDKFWVQKTGETKTTEIFTSFPMPNLKDNLRKLLKSKQATLIKAGASEAVSIDESMIYELFN